MMKNLNLFLLGLFILLSSGLYGQTIPYNQEYTLAKSDFERQEFSKAAQRFKNLLTRDPANEKATYAAFYYGIATYELDDLEAAKNIFQDGINNKKDGKKLPEAQRGLAKI